jgi:hypothetical protein
MPQRTEYIAFVLLIQQPPVLMLESMIAAVMEAIARLVPTVATQR